jgi:hypothetical protein
MGCLGELTAARAVGPGRGGGGSLKLEKMAVGEPAGAGEDGGGEEREGKRVSTNRRTLAPEAGRWPAAGARVTESATLDLVFFPFFGNYCIFFPKLECAVGRFKNCTRGL